jgi:lincosamide nucleotidyltransferase A/C/D/E
MTAESALALLDALQLGGVDACVGGGWAIDALVGEQTREHSDLDLWVDAAHLDSLIQVLAARELDRLLPWGGDRPWNFAVHDGAQLRIDLHLYEVLPGQLELHYGSVTAGVRFPVGSLTGVGRIGGRRVRCDSVAWAMQCVVRADPLIQRTLGGPQRGEAAAGVELRPQGAVEPFDLAGRGRRPRQSRQMLHPFSRQIREELPGEDSAVSVKIMWDRRTDNGALGS